mmetsp:Transcript_92267/g.232043  ORF Transcript_92267/g.232043 Transcript_92267/m.232043 type:complete len:251 (+) Transcript_92267:1281-2033(+)
MLLLLLLLFLAPLLLIAPLLLCISLLRLLFQLLQLLLLIVILLLLHLILFPLIVILLLLLFLLLILLLLLAILLLLLLVLLLIRLLHWLSIMLTLHILLLLLLLLFHILLCCPGWVGVPLLPYCALSRSSFVRCLLQELSDDPPGMSSALRHAMQAPAASKGLDAGQILLILPQAVEDLPVPWIPWRRRGCDPLLAVRRHRGTSIGQREGTGEDANRPKRACGVLAENAGTRGPHVADERPHVHPHCKVQ